MELGNWLVNGLYLGYRGLYPQLLTRNRVYPMAHLSTPEGLGGGGS